MAVETMEYQLPRIRWASVFAGAFCAVAVQIVLGLFGAAFGFGGEGAGVNALPAVWEVLTPAVALFAGSVLAISLDGRRNAYLNGFMVWCIFLAAVAFYLGRDIGTVTARADAIGLTRASATALAGFSALLGLAGAVVGSAIGKRVARYGRGTGAPRGARSPLSRAPQPGPARPGVAGRAGLRGSAQATRRRARRSAPCTTVRGVGLIQQ